MGATAGCTPIADPGQDDPVRTTQRGLVEDSIPRYLGYANEEKRARVMSDLLHMAFTCDLTRSATLVYTFAQCFIDTQALLGIQQTDVHELGHGAGSDEDKADAFAWHIEHFAYLVAKLRDTPEGAGSLLDNTVLVFMPEGGWDDGDPHSGENMLALIAGRAGGLRPGQHVATDGAHPAQRADQRDERGGRRDRDARRGLGSHSGAVRLTHAHVTEATHRAPPCERSVEWYSRGRVGACTAERATATRADDRRPARADARAARARLWGHHVAGSRERAPDPDCLPGRRNPGRDRTCTADRDGAARAGRVVRPTRMPRRTAHCSRGTVHYVCDCAASAEPGCRGARRGRRISPESPLQLRKGAQDVRLRQAGDVIAFCRGGSFTNGRRHALVQRRAAARRPVRDPRLRAALGRDAKAASATASRGRVFAFRTAATPITTRATT